MNENANNPELFVDNDPYQWAKKTITGVELRALAGIPAGVEIYQKVPGKPDEPVLPETEIDLSKAGPERFSTQAAGSQAG